MLAIQILKYFQFRRVVIHGDSQLVIKKMQGEYLSRHPRMRSYINAALYLIECEFNLIPILQNGIADYLATFVVVFKVPMYPNSKYEIVVKHIPCITDSVKHYHVFEADK